MLGKIIVYIALWLAGSFSLFAAPIDTLTFGEIFVQHNKFPGENYYVKSSKLYQNVTISYKDVLQLQSKEGLLQYYYIQLGSGKSAVLHIILERQAKKELSDQPRQYDLFINLGDSIAEVTTFDNVDSVIYFFPNGSFPQEQRYGRALNGQISISEPKADSREKVGVAGALDIQFDFPAFAADEYEHFHLKGDLRVPQANLFKGGVTGFERTKKQRGQYTRNILIAIGLTAIITAAVLLPN